MNILQINVSNPDDLLAAYSAGAVVRIESSPDNVTFTSIGTVPIVAGDTTYTFNHSAGTTTTYYRSRYENAVASLASEYSPVWRVGGRWTDIGRVKLLLKIAATDTSDDDRMRTAVDASNSWMDREIGMFLGPSSDTVRTYDVAQVCYEIFIKGGIRTLTTLEVATDTGASFSSVSATDVVLLPRDQDRLPGMAANRIKFLDVVTGSNSYFSAGYGVVRVTGEFGPAETPPALARIADTVAVWLYQSQQSGFGGMIGSPDIGEVVNRVLTPLDFRTLQTYRTELWWRSYM